MEITRIQQNTIPCRRNYAARLHSDFNRSCLYGDVFVLNIQHRNPAFTGRMNLFDLMKKYIERKSYKTSIYGSKRPYFSLADDLKPITNEVKISVSPFEKINALDINKNNSTDYVIYLHGFSQNIHDNQPLYREIAKTRFGILAPEYRGYGQNPPSINYKERDIMQDIASSVKYLKQKGCRCAGFVGHSFGAYIGAGAAKEQKPDFLIMVSPMISLEFWLKNVIKHPKKYKYEYEMIRCIKHYKELYRKIFDITEHFKGNYTPTYVIQSINDSYVRTCKVNSLTKRIANLKLYEKIPSGGHRMNEGKISEIKKILDSL